MSNNVNLREAATDLRYLLNRGYNRKSALELVGDKWNLNKESRHILYRAIFSLDEIKARHWNEVKINDINGKLIAIDTYNLLITMESIFKGLRVIAADDGYYRDISKVFSKYRQSFYTLQSIQIILDKLKPHNPKKVIFFLDKNISHSGELAKKIENAIRTSNMEGEAQTVPCSDASVISNGEVVISNDRVVLERSMAHLNLISILLENLKAGQLDVLKIE